MAVALARRLQEAVAPVVERAMAQGLIPGAAVGVVLPGGRERVLMGFGRTAHVPWAPRVTPETIYDLASLTKPLATALLVAIAVEEGRMALDTQIGEFLSPLSGDVGAIPVKALLVHRSGLPPWLPIYRYLIPGTAIEARKGKALALISSQPLDRAGSVYSDLGYILLGMALEEVYSTPLERLFLEKLGWSGLLCPGVEAGPDGMAPSEWCPVRGRVIQGEVHDLNAWALGGMAGHAGLFGSLAGVVDHLMVMRDAWQGTGADVVPICHLRNPGPGPPLMGFQAPDPGPSSAGSLFPRRAVGHLGFTGVSFWWAVEEEIIVVVLSNRTFPVAPDNPCRHGHRLVPDHPMRGRMLRFRAELHDAVMEVLLHGH